MKALRCGYAAKGFLSLLGVIDKFGVPYLTFFSVYSFFKVIF